MTDHSRSNIWHENRAYARAENVKRQLIGTKVLVDTKRRVEKTKETWAPSLYTKAQLTSFVIKRSFLFALIEGIFEKLTDDAPHVRRITHTRQHH